MFMEKIMANAYARPLLPRLRRPLSPFFKRSSCISDASARSANTVPHASHFRAHVVPVMVTSSDLIHWQRGHGAARAVAGCTAT